MKYIAFSLERLRTILRERGLKDRDLVKLLYTKDSHQTFDQIFTKTFGVQKLIAICNVLDISMDMLFDIDNSLTPFPNINGNNNNVNSTVINQHYASMKSENEALKMLIKEKDERIQDLRKNLDYVISLSKLGQNLDK